MNTSRRLKAAKCTLISISPGPATGVSNSSRCNFDGPPVSRKTIAFITRSYNKLSDETAGGGGTLFRKLGLAQFNAPDLAGARLRKFADELDFARVLVRRRYALTMLLQLAHQRRIAGVTGPQYDERLDDVAAIGIGRSNDGRFEHRRMFEQRALDLKGSDAIGTRGDHVVRAPHEPKIDVV